jgi:hypothetical protein
MLGTFLFLAALGFAAGVAWVPWWGLASVVARDSAARPRTRPTIR